MAKKFSVKAAIGILSAILAFAALVGIGFAGNGRAFADGVAEGELRIHFIECGQADSCLIQFPDGKNMLIDAGADLQEKAASYGKIITYLDETANAEKLDYVIMTHSDYDHIGGIPYVLEGREIGTAYRPSQICNASGYDDPALSKTGKEGFPYNVSNVANNKKKGSATYKNALDYCYNNAENVYVIDPMNDEINHIEGAATVNGESFAYTFDFYSPVEPPFSDANDYSPIMVLSYAGRNIVLSGDAEAQNEEQFVEKIRGGSDERYDRFRNSFDADIIKLGHHGSGTSSSEDYLRIMCSSVERRANTYTIFSCNDSTNDYGHPHAETLRRLMDMQFGALRIERTDLFGDIRFDLSADGKMTRYRGHNYTSGGKEYGDADPETIAAVLTSGSSKTREPEQMTDNGVRPNDNNSSGTTDPKPNPDKPADPETPTNPDDPPAPDSPFDWFLSLPLWAQILIIAGVALAVILFIVVIVKIGKGKKRSKRRRR